MDAGTTFDLAKLGVVPGGTVQVDVDGSQRQQSDDDARLGTLQQVQELYRRGQTLRLTQFLVRSEVRSVDLIDWKI